MRPSVYCSERLFPNQKLLQRSLAQRFEHFSRRRVKILLRRARLRRLMSERAHAAFRQSGAMVRYSRHRFGGLRMVG